MSETTRDVEWVENFVAQLEHGAWADQKEAARIIRRLQSDLERLDAALHARQAHPDYEYETTAVPRKSGVTNEPEGDGWEINEDYHDGFERFDFHEETYWRRVRAAGGDK